MRKLFTFDGPEATVVVYRKADTDEYVVRQIDGSRIGEPYFTDDRQDAIDTACHIAGIKGADRRLD